MPTLHNFRITTGAQTSAVQNTSSLQTALSQAVSHGGETVFDIFRNDLGAINKLHEDIATGGPSIWIDGTDSHTGLPTQYVSSGESQLVIGFYLTDAGKEAVESGTPGTGPDDWEDIGYSYVTLVTGAGTNTPRVSQLSTHLVQYVGDGIPEIAIENGLRDLVKTVVSRVKKFVTKTINLIAELATGMTAEEAKEAASRRAAQAAEEASIENEEIVIGERTITANMVFDVVQVVGFIFQLGVLALGILLRLISKRIVCHLRFYNTSTADIDLSICWVKEDAALASAPMLPQTPVTVPAVGPAWTPPWIIGDKAVHFVDIVIVNTDALKGVGVVLKADATDDFPGFNAMVNVPNRGKNSLNISFGREDDCHSYWQTHKNEHESLTISADHTPYSLRLATNQLDGTSPAPGDGTKGYNYEHLLALETSEA